MNEMKIKKISQKKQQLPLCLFIIDRSGTSSYESIYDVKKMAKRNFVDQF